MLKMGNTSNSSYQTIIREQEINKSKLSKTQTV